MSKELTKYVESLVIDKNFTITPTKVTKYKVTYTDHYGCVLTLKNIPSKTKKKVFNTKTIFNTNKEGGWECFQKLTTNNHKLNAPNVRENDNPDEIMMAITREVEKCKYKAFGKVKSKPNVKKDESINELINKKMELGKIENKTDKNADDINAIEEEIVKKIHNKQCKQLEKEISEIKEIKSKKGVAASIFHLKNKVTGPKKAGLVPTVIRNPETNKEETEPRRIRDVSVKYVKKLLTNRNPKEEYKEDMEMKRLLHENRMNVDVDSEENENILTRSQFE